VSTTTDLKTNRGIPTLRDTGSFLIENRSQVLLYGAALVMVVAFSISSPVFFSLDNFLNIGRQTSLVSIIAVGMTFVIISGQIDISVASNVALSGMVAAIAMQQLGDSWGIGAAAGILCGMAVGLINGIVTAVWRVPSFLVTLGMLGIARGTALLITDAKPVLINDPAYYAIFGEGSIAGIPAPILWTIIALAIGAVLLHGTRFGRRIYATGGNSVAARYSGINTVRTTVIAFLIVGALAGLAALVLTARFHAARPDLASGLELDVIAAVILGGTSLFGGRGLIFGTLMGSLIIGILNNGLVLLGVNSAAQLVIKGIIIIVAVGISNKR
jgi:ribose/xylose/arabinose/galactoside ABC-type transport system permease subunit